MYLIKTTLVAGMLLVACSDGKPLVVDSNSVEGEILLTMDKWGRSLTSGDIEATMEFYS